MVKGKRSIVNRKRRPSQLNCTTRKPTVCVTGAGIRKNLIEKRFEKEYEEYISQLAPFEQCLSQKLRVFSQ